MVCVHILHKDPSLCLEGGGRMTHTTLTDVQQAIAQLSVRSRLADSGLRSFSATSSRSMVSASDASPNRFSSSLHKLLYPLLSKRVIGYHRRHPNQDQPGPYRRSSSGSPRSGSASPSRMRLKYSTSFSLTEPGLSGEHSLLPELPAPLCARIWQVLAHPRYRRRARLGHLYRLPLYW
jgi:hypothetical protein